MSVVDLIAPQYLDAAAVIVPILFLYGIGFYGTFRRIRRTRFGAILYRSGEDDRRVWLVNVVLAAMFAAAFFLSMALLGVPFT